MGNYHLEKTENKSYRLRIGTLNKLETLNQFMNGLSENVLPSKKVSDREIIEMAIDLLYKNLINDDYTASIDEINTRMNSLEKDIIDINKMVKIMLAVEGFDTKAIDSMDSESYKKLRSDMEGVEQLLRYIELNKNY